MIKKIPIKGISRDPSGQVTADGFCAESLNVQLDMGEVAPAIKPTSVKDASGNGISVEGDILFIHKGIDYENLLYRVGNAISYTATIGSASSGIVYGSLGNDETINDVTSIGNTVIVSTDKDMYYILWKEDAYHFLGNQIPVPALHFRMGGLTALRTIPNVANIDWTDPDESLVDAEGFSKTKDDCPVFPHEEIGDISHYGYSSKKYAFDYDYDKGVWNEYLDVVWGQIDEKLNEQSRNGKAVFPMFLRYAVRLYDGTVYSQSIPILLGSELARYIDAKAAVNQQTMTDSEGVESNFLTVFASLVKVADGYSIVMDAHGQGNVFDGWEDIVTSLDIFVSPQIKPLQRNAAKFDMEYKITEDLVGVTMRGYSISNFVADPYYTVDNQDKMVLNYQNTYLVKSFTLDEFKGITNDYTLEFDTSSDYIMSQEAMKETPQSMHYTKGGGLFNYNKRLVMTGSEQVLSTGYQFLHSVSWKNETSIERSSFRFVYHLRGENGQNVVICRDVSGNASISRQKKAVLEGNPTQYVEAPFSWLAYPDSRCYQIDVYEDFGNSITKTTFTTMVFDQADVAYVFTGFGQQIGRPVDSDMQVPGLPTYEDRTYRMPNSLVVSKSNNPFVFPAQDVVTFTAGEVLNIAVATTALSEGQFGQFPLYVFTDEGVFALSVDAEGKFQTSHPVTRDILLNKDSVVGIEQGVFFAAKRGLLLLQGSKVTKMSAEMDGTPSVIDEDFSEVLRSGFGITVENPLAFHEYLLNCKMAYDYANSRILLLNPSCNTQYVYKFDTQSWHRLCIGDSYPIRALNSYPEAQVVMKGGKYQSVVDFSVVAESSGAESLPGIIYTRDLDLDAPDIYKTVYRLEVRGRFRNRHVRWQLQGSNDGMNYTTIHSLRGPSWKWYRILLVTQLGPDERVSYVEMNYEPKFVDKIR